MFNSDSLPINWFASRKRLYQNSKSHAGTYILSHGLVNDNVLFKSTFNYIKTQIKQNPFWLITMYKPRLWKVIDFLERDFCIARSKVYRRRKIRAIWFLKQFWKCSRMHFAEIMPIYFMALQHIFLKHQRWKKPNNLNLFLNKTCIGILYWTDYITDRIWICYGVFLFFFVLEKLRMLLDICLKLDWEIVITGHENVWWFSNAFRLILSVHWQKY